MLERLKMFFDKSFYFWQITKILFIIMFSFALYGESKSRTLIVTLIMASIFGLFVLSMIYSLLLANQSQKILKIARYYSSIFAIFFGLFLSYSMLTLISGKWYQNIGFQIVPLWIILFGIREFLTITTANSRLA